MIEKMERFVKSLSDEEIDNQLNNIFDWAKIYKELLENERKYRLNFFDCEQSSFGCQSFDGFEYVDIEGNQDNIEDSVEKKEELTIDYELAQLIREKVSKYSVEKTRENIEKLKEIPIASLTSKEQIQLKYELETCEMHLFDLTGEFFNENRVCIFCGEKNEIGAKFCANCGKQLKEINA